MIPLVIIVVGISALAFFVHHHNPPQNGDKNGFISDKDNASSDTPVETLKTLTAEISSVEQQNRKLVSQNNQLTEQNKNSFADFQSAVLGKVQQQLENFKTQSKPTAENVENNNADSSSGTNAESDTTAATTDTTSEDQNPNTPTFTWVGDMQNTATNSDKDPSNDKLATLLHQETTDTTLNAQVATAQDDNNNRPLTNLDNPQIKPVIPYYTIPVNATLTGAIAMMPIIGRIPISGKVPDPYTFKAILGTKNLAANGIDIPPDLQGIVVSGVAEGDLLGECARGDIRAMTFVFQDGRISTTEAKTDTALGTIAAANGNPCIQGSFHTDAPLFLGVTAGLAGMQGYGNALAQAQLNKVTTAEGSTISSLLGNANTYAAGQGFSAASQAAQQWWNQRVQNSFDFVYVPNVDLKTGKKLKLNINITQEIPIDYDPKARKVFYDHNDENTDAENLD